MTTHIAPDATSRLHRSRWMGGPRRLAPPGDARARARRERWLVVLACWRRPSPAWPSSSSTRCSPRCTSRSPGSTWSTRRSGSGCGNYQFLFTRTRTCGTRPATRCGSSSSWCRPGSSRRWSSPAMLLTRAARRRRLPHAVLPAGAGAAGRRHARLRLPVQARHRPGQHDARRRSASTGHCGSTRRRGPSRRCVLLGAVGHRRHHDHLPGRAARRAAEQYEAASLDGAGALADGSATSRCRAISPGGRCSRRSPG